MTNLAPLVPLFPLLGALVAAIGGKWLKERSHWPIIIAIGLAFAVSLGLLGSVGDGGTRVFVYEWFHAGDLIVPIEFRVDGLTTIMLSMVTFVATLVAIFAAGYMHGDPAYPRFFALVGLFVFCMTGLVLSNNYLLTYAFWEGVGVCSYLLIGFWHAKPAAAAAAKKAFLVNRVGDFGFAVAIFLMWTSFGHSLSYDEILNPEKLAMLPHATKAWIAFLLFWAATAKSAQVPLYVWLPDAMEGPTPVSALIHAATMVTAGVYLIARSSLLMIEVPEAQVTIAVVGCLTALLAALIALTQTDLKRVMAYSTVSQLGYMFMALGAGVSGAARLAIVAAMFHLFTHAFFKALLFLSSGSVMHAMGGVIDMRYFGGLRKRLPYTYMTFAAGALALAGIVPFAGFWSKDENLAALKLASHEASHVGIGGWIYSIIYWMAIVTAGLTAFYTGRAFFITFWGPERLPKPEEWAMDSAASHNPHDSHGNGHEHEADHSDHGHHDDHFGHESPMMMCIPLLILAVCAILVGLLFGPTGLFESQLMKTQGFEHDLPHVKHSTDWGSIIVGTVAAISGLVLAYLFYGTTSKVPAILAARSGRLYRASREKFYFDEIYEAAIVRPLRILATLSRVFDEYVIQNLVALVAWVPRFVGKSILGPFQNGLVQYYAAVTALSLAGLLLILLLI